MSIIRCYVDEKTEALLRLHAYREGRTVEELAEAAIADAALRAVPIGMTVDGFLAMPR